MRRIAALIALTLAACGPNSALPLAGLNPLNLLPTNLFSTALPDDGEEPDGPYIRLAQGSRASDARLISQQGDRRMWRTRGGVVVATDGARVVATAGLPTMLAATRFDGPDPLADPRALSTRSADTRRVIDLMTQNRDPASMRFGIALSCRLTSRDSTEADQLVITEICRGEGIGTIRNRFWLDRDTHSIHTSEQWIGPGTRPLRIDHDLEPSRDEAPDATPAELPVTATATPAETVDPEPAVIRTSLGRAPRQPRPRGAPRQPRPRGPVTPDPD